jgi:SPP1 gp7 family putative phage head morphogenesis protein
MLKSPEFLALYRATAAQLSEGLENGYGQKIAAVKWNSPDAVLLGKLTESLYVFSANKDYQLLTELSELLVVEGTVRSYASFESEALKLHQGYNVNWLRTEYDTAVATGQMAAKWPGFQVEKDKYFLKYTTANDDRVRPTHKELDGILLPVDHEFWNTHYPPLGWHCRCNVVRVPRAGRSPSTQKDIDGLTIKAPEFGHNAPKTGVVFPDSHQYNNVPKDVAPLLRRTASADAPKPTKPNE